MATPGIIALAQHAYPFILVAQRQGQTIYYSHLTQQFYGNFAGVDPHGGPLAAALGHIVARCRANGLPALSSLVVTMGNNRPGPGYYPAAHGLAETDPGAIPAWQTERALALAATYPPNLP